MIGFECVLCVYTVVCMSTSDSWLLFSYGRMELQLIEYFFIFKVFNFPKCSFKLNLLRGSEKLIFHFIYGLKLAKLQLSIAAFYNTKKMASRASEQVRYIDQGKFPIYQKEISDMQCDEVGKKLIYSNKFAVIGIAEEKRLGFYSFEEDNSVMAECSNGGKSMSDYTISFWDFDSEISAIDLSPDEQFIVVLLKSNNAFVFELKRLKFIVSYNIYNIFSTF